MLQKLEFSIYFLVTIAEKAEFWGTTHTKLTGFSLPISLPRWSKTYRRFFRKEKEERKKRVTLTLNLFAFNAQRFAHFDF